MIENFMITCGIITRDNRDKLSFDINTNVFYLIQSFGYKISTSSDHIQKKCKKKSDIIKKIGF